MSILDSSKLAKNNRCSKMRARADVPLRSEKTPTINKPIACREVVIDYLYGKLKLQDVPAALAAKFKDIGYVNAQQELANLEEMTKQVMRYLEKEEQNKGTRFFLDPKPLVINCFGTDVRVKPDALIDTGTRIQAVKFKFKKPDIALAGARNDQSVTTALECYLLWLYAEQFAMSSDTICDGGYVYTGKTGTHEHDIDFGILEPSNTTAYRMLSFAASAKPTVDNLFLPVWTEFQVGSTCDEADCMFCPFTNACHFNAAPIIIKQQVHKQMGDVILSPAQEQAVNFIQGIGRIKAGAGAGKTLVVSLRVMTLLSAGYEPEKMLLITFTTNGAAEMRQRIQFFCEEYGFPPETAEKITITTFNSFGQMAIDKEYAFLGYSEPPQVVDSILRKKMILDAIQSEYLPGINYKSFELPFGNGGFDVICSAFEYFKMWGINQFTFESTDEEIQKRVQNAPVPINDAWMRVYAAYEDALKTANLIEYADQQRLLEEILLDNPYYIEEEYGYQHIIVDEFQDTSPQEVRLLKKLVDAKDFISLLVVGDDSQNIFESMRGTDNDNIIHFDEKIGEEITDFQLMENYRSTPEIIDVANKINAKRTSKLDGDLVAKRPDGSPIEVFAFASQKREYAWVADSIADKVNAGVAPETIAFIAKDGNELKAMGHELTARGIPSQLLTPEKVNMNSRVIAAIALAEFLANTAATQCAFDFLNTIQDGQLFEKTAAEITEEIESFVKTIEAEKGEKNDIDLFFEWLDKLDSSDETYKQFADKLDKFTSFDDVLAYARAMKRFGQKESYRRKVYSGKGVILTTVHSSKGLEWPVVYVSVTKFNNATKLEESRRVLFTAVTRARDELICTGVANKKGRAYIEEIFGYAGKPFEVIPDEDDAEARARKERAAEVREVVNRARKEAETFRY